MRVATIYHAGRDSSHRERQRALVRAGAEVLLVVPDDWPGPDDVHEEPFELVETAMWRPGSVNAHALKHPRSLLSRIAAFEPDVVDVHAEPFSVVMRQVLRALGPHQTVVAYTAQNIDKRFPPPFAQWERRALSRLDGLYPCSRQAASVAVGKGFSGSLDVLPLGVDTAMHAGQQRPPSTELSLLLVGRLVPEKGVLDAVHVLARLRDVLPTRLTLVGEGPGRDAAVALASQLGVSDSLTVQPWVDAATLADYYRSVHVVLVPSRATATWVEQFGRVVIEAQACGAVVVAYDSGALPEVVGRAGILVAEASVDQLAAGVASLVDQPDRWAALRARGLEATATCTWEAVATRQLDLYDAARHAHVRAGLRPGRSNARAQFGPPARVGGQDRPFATPLPRPGTRTARLLGALIDALDARRTR